MFICRAETLNEEVIIFVFLPVWLITVPLVPRKRFAGVKLRFLGESLGGLLYSAGRRRTSGMQGEFFFLFYPSSALLCASPPQPLATLRLPAPSTSPQSVRGGQYQPLLLAMTIYRHVWSRTGERDLLRWEVTIPGASRRLSERWCARV